MTHISRRSMVSAAIGMFVFAPGLAQADVFTNVPEAAGYTLVYELPIPANQDSYNSSAIPYTTDISGSFPSGSYGRVGYYLELAGSADVNRPNGFVYASFDATGIFATGSNLGVPSNGSNGTGVSTNTTVANLNVVSNVPGIVTGTGLAGGKVEFWPSNYGTGANGVFDHDDDGFNTGSGHGSMQIHNTAVPQTLFGYSDWGGNTSGAASEIGIGNQPIGQPDWTFSDSGTTYTLRNLQIVVDGTPPPPPPPPAPGSVEYIGGNIISAPQAEGCCGGGSLFNFNGGTGTLVGVTPTDQAGLDDRGSGDGVYNGQTNVPATFSLSPAAGFDLITGFQVMNSTNGGFDDRQTGQFTIDVSTDGGANFINVLDTILNTVAGADGPAPPAQEFLLGSPISLNPLAGQNIIRINSVTAFDAGAVSLSEFRTIVQVSAIAVPEPESALMFAWLAAIVGPFRLFRARRRRA